MIINNIPFGADLGDILTELRSQLALNNIPLLERVRDSPDNIMVSCPYHKNGQERKPSAGIKKSDGTFHCFTCGETHSLQEVISYCFGHYDDIVGAFGWDWLLKNFATISIENRRVVELDLGRNVQTISIPKFKYVPDDELDRYRVYHPYMWKRKMTPEVIDVFDIGFDAETNCITFPVRDLAGKTVFVARRSVSVKFFNYPAGAMKPVYGIYELSQLKTYPNEVYICESMIDAITVWAYGKYAVALNGLGNELQFEQLNAMPCRKFILATDGDEAGQKARARLRKNIKHKLITEVIFPSGRKDINDLSQEEFDNLEEVF